MVDRPASGGCTGTFKELKHDLGVRPVFHQREDRIEPHIFGVTLKNLTVPRASGLTPHCIPAKLSTMDILDVRVPTTDGRRLVLSRRTGPTPDRQLLLHQLDRVLPKHPGPGCRSKKPVANRLPQGRLW